MNRSIQTTNFGEGFLRHTVRIENEATPGEGQPGYVALAIFLQALSGMPDLMRHIGPCPSTINFYHESGRWICEAVTIVPRPPDPE